MDDMTKPWMLHYHALSNEKRKRFIKIAERVEKETGITLWTDEMLNQVTDLHRAEEAEKAGTFFERMNKEAYDHVLLAQDLYAKVSNGE